MNRSPSQAGAAARSPRPSAVVPPGRYADASQRMVPRGRRAWQRQRARTTTDATPEAAKGRAQGRPCHQR
eukprot:1369528-Alexandrium_andersonii.AAC.1